METRRPARRGLARVRPGLVAATLAGLAVAGGCGSEVIDVDADAGAGASGQVDFQVFGKVAASGIDKIDLLLVVDNSRSMADKQQILAATVPDVIRGLVAPS